jgi:divalent metal cation (Fe/Co/Zn/Cd) transporter
MGGLFSIYEGWHKLHATEPLNRPWIALLVLGVSIVLESGSLAGCLREINKLRGNKPFGQWLAGTRNAELVVVLGEDIAALVGLVLAMGFVALATLTGNPVFDAIGSITIGAVLIFVSIFIAVRIKGLIIGRAAEDDLRAAINAEIEADPAILELLNAITVQLGPQVMLAVKIRMAPELSIGDAVDHINRLEARIKAKFPEVKWCFVEPDNAD